MKDIKERTKKLGDVKGDVLALEQENKELKQEIEFRKTKEYIEQEARNKLNLAKPGEVMFVIPEKTKEEFKEVKKDTNENNADTSPKQIYKLWLKVFGSGGGS